jgi:hypothetical protein
VAAVSGAMAGGLLGGGAYVWQVRFAGVGYVSFVLAVLGFVIGGALAGRYALQFDPPTDRDRSRAAKLRRSRLFRKLGKKRRR